MAALSMAQSKRPAHSTKQAAQQAKKKSTRERWVMLNKERFHEIFNETLLNEIPEVGRESPDVGSGSADVGSGSAEVGRESPVEVRDSPVEVRDSLIEVRDSQNNVRDTSKNVRDSPVLVRDSPTNVPDSLVVVRDPPKQVRDSQNNVRVIARESPKNVRDSPKQVRDSPILVRESPKQVRDSPKQVRDSPTQMRESPKQVRDSPILVRDSPILVRDLPNVSRHSPEVASRECVSPRASVSDVRCASHDTPPRIPASRKYTPGKMTHPAPSPPCDPRDMSPEVVMPLNLKVSNSRDTERQEKVPNPVSTPVKILVPKIPLTPPVTQSQQKTKNQAEKVARSASKTNPVDDKEKATRLLAPNSSEEGSSVVATTSKSSLVCSDLLKNRPLVSAALFGNQPGGSESSRMEIIPPAPRNTSPVQDPANDPTPVSVPIRSTHPSSPVPPPQPQPQQSNPNSELTPLVPFAVSPTSAATTAVAASYNSQRSGDGDYTKNASATVYECNLVPPPPSPKNVVIAECSRSKHSTDMEVQRQNWVTLSKSTLYNLVDELVGSRLGSSGEEEDDDTKDTPTSKSPVSVSNPRRSRRTSHNSHSQKDTAAKPLLKARSPPPLVSIPPASNKQVLKQCWVALNKTLVFDMVEQAMAGEKPEKADPQSPPSKPASTYRDEENHHNHNQGNTQSQSQTQSQLQEPVKQNKRPLEEPTKVSRKRKRVSEVRRPASAPVDGHKKNNESQSLNRAPSPYSKEYEVLHKEHAANCDKLLREARQRLAANAPSPSASHPQALTNPRDASRDSPKLGWVAVSKAEVHTIVDSVMSSMLDIEDGNGNNKAAAPKHPAPHRPWLASSSSAASLKQAGGSGGWSSESPEASSPDSSAASSPNPDAATHPKTPFKWKSSLMLRVNEQCNPGPPLDPAVPLDMTSKKSPPPSSSSSSPSSLKSVSLDSSSNSSKASTSPSNSHKRKSRSHKSK